MCTAHHISVTLIILPVLLAFFHVNYSLGRLMFWMQQIFPSVHTALQENDLAKHGRKEVSRTPQAVLDGDVRVHTTPSPAACTAETRNPTLSPGQSSSTGDSALVLEGNLNSALCAKSMEQIAFLP